MNRLGPTTRLSVLSFNLSTFLSHHVMHCVLLTARKIIHPLQPFTASLCLIQGSFRARFRVGVLGLGQRVHGRIRCLTLLLDNCSCSQLLSCHTLITRHLIIYSITIITSVSSHYNSYYRLIIQTIMCVTRSHAIAFQIDVLSKKEVKSSPSQYHCPGNDSPNTRGYSNSNQVHKKKNKE